MKIESVWILLSLVIVCSCVTGNDDSQVLADMQRDLETTPQVLDLTVNGIKMKRDSLSNWIPIGAVAGENLTITFIINSGNGAASSSLLYSRYYHHDFTPFGLRTGLDPGYELLLEENFPEGETEMELNYVVPATDDDSIEFHSGDIINIAFWTENSNSSVGYNDFNIVFE